MYEVFEHTADIGIRVLAPDVDALFREAAEALVALVVEDLAAGGAPREIALEGRRLDWLLFDWLTEVLYAIDGERLLLGGFDVHVAMPDGDAVDAPARLRATARAQPLDPASQRLSHEVKAVTYHRLRVERAAAGWIAEFIVDI